MDVLQRMSVPDLIAVGSALRSGRLDTPFSEVAVRRYCAASFASALAAEFSRLADEGMQSRHIGVLVDAVAASRTRTFADAEPVELVWTGPESAGVTNRDTGVVVRDLFGSAMDEVIVAGFAVHQGREIFRRLAERMIEIPSLRVRLFLDVRRPHGDTTVASELLWKFVTRFRTSEWPGDRVPELFYDPRSLDENQEKRSSLHAKCVVVDRRIALVTSANFTEAAQTRNIEVGALIRSQAFARELAEHFDQLAAAKVLMSIGG
jgi:phosphatidylserine/phosphatidylglycerophosphate/cardiolipin synthase-like enzyme